MGGALPAPVSSVLCFLYTCGCLHTSYGANVCPLPSVSPISSFSPTPDTLSRSPLGLGKRQGLGSRQRPTVPTFRTGIFVSLFRIVSGLAFPSVWCHLPPGRPQGLFHQERPPSSSNMETDCSLLSISDFSVYFYW